MGLRQLHKSFRITASLGVVGLLSSQPGCSASSTPPPGLASESTKGTASPLASSPTGPTSTTPVPSVVDAGVASGPDGPDGGVSDAGGAGATASKACPQDMVLVDGDYCTKLDVRCKKKWYAPQNHLWVCEEVQKPTRCTGSTVHMRYCIDRYEYPNKKGQRPMVMQNFYQAQLHCANQGKRMCTESEWTKACEGPDNKPFPYGYVRDATKCHGDQPYGHPSKKLVMRRSARELERLWQGVISGSQPNCVSDYGVHDLPANADELAASERYTANPKANFDNVTTGGPWYKGVRNMCRPKIYSHDESFAYYYLSWRCCKEADGKPTDPRAPKQMKRGWKWDRIVWKAKNSWLLPFNPKVPGDPGYCSAGPDRKAVPFLNRPYQSVPK